MNFTPQHQIVQCNECKREMAVEMFHNGVSHLMGLSIWCPDCRPIFEKKLAAWKAQQQEVR